MRIEEQIELMVRMEECLKHVVEDVSDIKETMKDINVRIDSFESVLSEHKKYMEEHPIICKTISDIEKKLSRSETIYEVVYKIGALVNAALLIYFASKGLI